MTKKGPLALIILDGFGLRSETRGNAVALARKPHFDELWNTYPHTTLSTSGTDVGLPPGQMGNSEVGHMNLGAGRVVMQDLLRINRSIEQGEFFEIPTLISELKKVAASPAARLHVLGLVSDGGVHSHLEHVKAILHVAKSAGVRECFVHAFTDGRDTGPKTGLDCVKNVTRFMGETHFGKFASVSGRFYAMDRDQRWERVEQAYAAMCLGKGKRATSATEAIENAYQANETDEFISPTVMVDASGNPLGQICDGDGIFYFNFRPDRCREMIQALTAPDFKGFERPHRLKLATLTTMTSYSEDYQFPVAFSPQDLSLPLGEVISLEGLTQLRAAETEKFPHVTYFFDCAHNQPFAGEERLLIPSPRDVKTYDQKPQMSAPELTAALLKKIRDKHYDFILLNFANTDMVGHTGVLEAGIKAVETVDHCLSQILAEILKQKGSALVTADHGNCEQMIQDDGTPHTSHTLNPVPLIFVDPSQKNIEFRSGGILADIAPTCLKLLGLHDSPSGQRALKVMNGKPLF